MSKSGAIEIVNASVTIIKMIARGLAPKSSILGSATGFFFEDNSKRFLVTNRHVVIDEKEERYPDGLVIQVHTDRTHAPPCREITLALYDKENKPLWLEHPDSNDKNRVDVVVLEIGHELKPSDFIRCWTVGNFISTEAQIAQGTSLNVIGYPLGFYDTVNNLPVTRSGSLASPFWTHFRGQPLFLIDANLHAGTSGSPVILPRSTIPNISEITNEKFPHTLLGINSGEYLGLGLNAVWYAYLLLDIVSQ